MIYPSLSRPAIVLWRNAEARAGGGNSRRCFITAEAVAGLPLQGVDESRRIGVSGLHICGKQRQWPPHVHLNLLSQSSLVALHLRKAVVCIWCHVVALPADDSLTDFADRSAVESDLGAGPGPYGTHSFGVDMSQPYEFRTDHLCVPPRQLSRQLPKLGRRHW